MSTKACTDGKKSPGVFTSLEFEHETLWFPIHKCTKYLKLHTGLNLNWVCCWTGHFLLTEMLLDKMVETAEETGIEGRIVNVSSVVHNWVKRDHFCFNQMLNPKK